MPIRTVLDTKIEHISILDENGKFDEKLGKGLIPDKDIVKLYQHIVLCRRYDEIAFKLQRSGRMGTYPENRGQEATSLGAAYALEKSDWLVENRLEKAEPWFRMQVAPGVINARSRIKLVACKNNLAHFRLYPLTGKQHQLRLHMSGLGLSIMNDRYYPELLAKQADDLENPLQLLAKRVHFTDPVSGQEMQFESERKLLF